MLRNTCHDILKMFSDLSLMSTSISTPTQSQTIVTPSPLCSPQTTKEEEDYEEEEEEEEKGLEEDDHTTTESTSTLAVANPTKPWLAVDLLKTQITNAPIPTTLPRNDDHNSQPLQSNSASSSSSARGVADYTTVERAVYSESLEMPVSTTGSSTCTPYPILLPQYFTAADSGGGSDGVPLLPPLTLTEVEGGEEVESRRYTIDQLLMLNKKSTTVTQCSSDEEQQLELFIVELLKPHYLNVGNPFPLSVSFVASSPVNLRSSSTTIATATATTTTTTTTITTTNVSDDPFTTPPSTTFSSKQNYFNPRQRDGVWETHQQHHGSLPHYQQKTAQSGSYHSSSSSSHYTSSSLQTSSSGSLLSSSPSSYRSISSSYHSSSSSLLSSSSLSSHQSSASLPLSNSHNSLLHSSPVPYNSSPSSLQDSSPHHNLKHASPSPKATSTPIYVPKLTSSSTTPASSAPKPSWKSSHHDSAPVRGAPNNLNLSSPSIRSTTKENTKPSLQNSNTTYQAQHQLQIQSNKKHETHSPYKPVIKDTKYESSEPGPVIPTATTLNGGGSLKQSSLPRSIPPATPLSRSSPPPMLSNSTTTTTSTSPSASPPSQASPNQEETDPHRLQQRQKQIDYGHRTLGYVRYRIMIPLEQRRSSSSSTCTSVCGSCDSDGGELSEYPQTPRKNQCCSKRSWDGQVKKWRRELHKWDPTDTKDLDEFTKHEVLSSIFEPSEIPLVLKQLDEQILELRQTGTLSGKAPNSCNSNNDNDNDDDDTSPPQQKTAPLSPHTTTGSTSTEEVPSCVNTPGSAVGVRGGGGCKSSSSSSGDMDDFVGEKDTSEQPSTVRMLVF